MSKKIDILDETADFSLVLGGPLYQLFLRARLITPSLGLVHRRVVGIALLAWLPLLLLTAFTDHALAGAEVPFLLDLDVHARFLIALPLLIAAELIVHARIRPVIRQFLERDLIAAEDRARFQDIIDSTMRLRNSVLLEVLLIVFAFTGGHWVWTQQGVLNVATWYAAPEAGHMHLTVAGYWYAFVSLPLFRFIGFRWYMRLLLWYWFLWRVSRLELRLKPLHPDRAGGLGFLTGSLFAFAPVLIAHTVLYAGLIGNRIWHEGAQLPDYKMDIAFVLSYLVLLVLLPLTFFVLQLADAKRDALREYGILASQYVSDFRQRWLEGNIPRETLLGSADIQSLADLGNSYDVVREMRPLPVGLRTVVQLGILIALPFLPLTLTIIPLDQLVDRMVDIVL